MANFQVSLTNPTTGKVDITDANDILSIVDWSNYSDSSPEAGHTKSDFAHYRRMKLFLPNNTTYLFSSLYPSEGNATLPVPSSSTLPITTNYNYTTGDGRYKIILYVLPTWNSSAAYLSANNVYVYRNTNGKIYKCLQNSTNNIPESSPTYWQEVTDVEILPSKYRLEQNIVIVSQMRECWARRVFAANCINHKIGCRYEELFDDEEFIDAVRLSLSMHAAEVFLMLSDWDAIDNIINFTKEIEAKYSSL